MRRHPAQKSARDNLIQDRIPYVTHRGKDELWTPTCNSLQTEASGLANPVMFGLLPLCHPLQHLFSLTHQVAYDQGRRLNVMDQTARLARIKHRVLDITLEP